MFRREREFTKVGNYFNIPLLPRNRIKAKRTKRRAIRSGSAELFVVQVKAYRLSPSTFGCRSHGVMNQTMGKVPVCQLVSNAKELDEKWIEQGLTLATWTKNLEGSPFTTAVLRQFQRSRILGDFQFLI